MMVVSDAAWDKKAGVVDATGLIKAEDITAETRTSSFALVVDSTRYYREFTKDELGEKNMLKFYRTRSTDKEYLYASEAADLNLLAVEGKGDNADALAEMTVIPTTETGVLMPQYFIGRNVITSSEATIAVPAGVVYVTVEGEAAVPAIVK